MIVQAVLGAFISISAHLLPPRIRDQLDHPPRWLRMDYVIDCVGCEDGSKFRFLENNKTMLTVVWRGGKYIVENEK